MAGRRSAGMRRRRSASRRRSRATQFRLTGHALRELLAVLLVVGAVISTVAIFAPEAGFLIRPWHAVLSYLFGWGIAFAPPLMAGFAVMLWMKTMPIERWMTVTGAALVTLGLLGVFHLAGGGAAAVEAGEGGGWFGHLASAPLSAAIGTAGTWVVLALLMLLGLLLYFNMTVGDLLAVYLRHRDEHREAAAAGRQNGSRRNEAPRAEARPGKARLGGGLLERWGRGGEGEERPAGEPAPLIVRRQRAETGRPGATTLAAVPISADLERAGDLDALAADESAHLATASADGAPLDAALADDERSWELPSLDLLADAGPTSAAQLDLGARGQLIRETLANFRIGVRIARIQEGPVVTQYALEVDPGIKLSRIEGLADNLALALSARSIRIEAPIPGQPYVGIEIPNTAFDLVTLKEVLSARAFEEASARSTLAFALGQDVAGQPFAADLARMPHVLIAGATGSGKSVCINALICSLLTRATPAEVKLILIDPKRVELAQYKGIPHLLTEVIVEPEKAVNALKWTVGAMEARYHDFAGRGVRNIAGYNESLRNGEPPMPYIVVIIDELADLMMVSAYEVESTITRIAQLARATGIHLVVATQRPSVQVVTGLIKANVPSRIAFAMTSGIDSRTILDTTGAEDLLGRGDMLYQPIDAPRAVRLQGVLVTDAEVEALARHWRIQGAPQYRPEITAPKPGGRGGEGSDGDDEGGEADPLFRQAVDLVRRSDKASASLLQRRLRIGYARAARILDQMEDRGIVGPADGSKFREVLVTPDGWGGDVGPDDDEPER